MRGRAMRLVYHSSKFVTGQFLVYFRDLGWEAIVRACAAIADKACDLCIGFQRRPDRFDLSFLASGETFLKTAPTCSRTALKKACWSSSTVPLDRGP